MEKKGDSPKKDFFKVKNDWWEALILVNMPGATNQCLRYIIRMTYGWQRKEAEIPMKDFESATGLKIPHISRSLKSLKDAKMIIVTKNGNNLDKRLLTYSFNKYFDQWLPIVTNYGNKKQVTGNGNDKLPETVTNVVKNGNLFDVTPITSKDILKTVKDKERRTSKKKTFDPRSIPYQLAETLLSQIIINIPDFKQNQNSIREATLQRWAIDIDKMIRLDNRKPCHIFNMILWLQDTETETGGFWFKNILSAKKLRKQYDKLSASIQSELRKKSRNKSQHDKLLELGEKWLNNQEMQDS